MRVDKGSITFHDKEGRGREEGGVGKEKKDVEREREEREKRVER